MPRAGRPSRMNAARSAFASGGDLGHDPGAGLAASGIGAVAARAPGLELALSGIGVLGRRNARQQQR